jgi:hypothetical protein
MAEPNKYQIVKMKMEWMESLFPHDGDFVELQGNVWCADVFPDYTEHSYVLREATEREKEVWKAFNTLADFYFKR